MSPVVSDAIELDTPFAVPSRPFWSALDMLAAYPTLAGGAVLDTSRRADLPAQLAGALQDDAHAPDRARLRRDVMGADDPGGFQQRFQQAVDEALATQATRRSFARPSA